MLPVKYFSFIKLLPWLFFLAVPELVSAVEADSFFVHTDMLYTEGNRFCQDIYFIAAGSIKVNVRLACYCFRNDGDSLLLYKKEVSGVMLKKGPGKVTLVLGQGKYYIDPVFSRVMKKINVMPPGVYRCYLYIGNDSLQWHVHKVFIEERDSLLPVNSGLYKGITGLINPVREHSFITTMNNKAPPAALDKAWNVFSRSRLRIERYCRKRGLTCHPYRQGGKACIDIYDEGWFAGRYVLQEEGSLSRQIADAENAFSDHAETFTHNQLSNYQSLLSQFRELKKDSRAHNEITGEIALSANFSNDQEPFSTLDNNYYEARGSLEFPLLGIPVGLDGYYTTQDRHRQAKASYIHFHYDAEKAKEELLTLIGSYNKQYAQTLAQGDNYQMIYGQFVQQLQAQKDQAIAALEQESGLNPSMPDKDAFMAQLKGLAQKAEAKAEDSVMSRMRTVATGTDTAGAGKAVQKAREAAQEKYRRLQEQYQRLLAAEEKINHYRQLLEQYRNTLYCDSAMAFDKIRDLRNTDNLSYKDLAKKASALLPDSKLKGFATGLTAFDAGMFPAYVSDYTLSGQMLKGVSAGYDIGVATVGATYGKTEYVDGNGSVESYKAYSASVQLKPVAKQHFGFVYYGYTPAMKLFGQEAFFKSTDISLPSFRNPVHIVSATYNGSVSRYLSLNGEYAFSNQQGQSPEAASSVSFKDRSSYNLSLSGNIPYTTLSLDAAYEHAGKSFENNTLPVILSGTDRIRVSGAGDFFHSFLTLGVEYNYLLQNNFYTTGHNAQWGFELQTHSRRFPTVFLSYKPFSTFRSINDTLSIAQKPLIGSVWTGRLNYQIKNLSRALRFSVLYNRNNSIMDTVQYASALVEGSIIYTRGSVMLSLNAGVTDIQTTYIAIAYPGYDNNQFASFAAAGNLSRDLNVTMGTDVAKCAFGWSRYGVMGGATYSFRKMPVVVNASFRYSRYRLDETIPWKALYSGSVTLGWRFRMKLSDR